jgi:hypothetical protein
MQAFVLERERSTVMIAFKGDQFPQSAILYVVFSTCAIAPPTETWRK